MVKESKKKSKKAKKNAKEEEQDDHEVAQGSDSEAGEDRAASQTKQNACILYLDVWDKHREEWYTTPSPHPTLITEGRASLTRRSHFTGSS